MAVFTLDRVERVLLLGGGELLLDFAERCLARGVTVEVITSPRHAAEQVRSSRLGDLLHGLGVRTLEVGQFSGEILARWIGPMQNTVALSLGAAWVFRRDTIDEVFGGRLLNVHGTRLPRDQGGGGWSWQIMNGNRLGMCLVHLVDEGLDTGPVVSSQEFVFPASCRVPADFSEAYRSRLIPFLDELVGRMSAGHSQWPLSEQSHHLSTYFPRLSTQVNGWIDWAWPAEAIERFVCAFDRPFAGASTRWQGKVVRLQTVSRQGTDGAFHQFQSGLVYRAGPAWLMVAAPDGQLIVESVTDTEGVSCLGEVRAGDRFFTPPDDLTTARRRVSYTPAGLSIPES